jgi:predicted nucleic acid-binding protein
MKRLRKNMRQFLVDTNVFVAAIINPEKKARTLDLILELITFEKFKSETTSHLLKRLRDRITISEN